MLRFLAILTGIVVVVWVLSLFAAPPIPLVEGRDITTPDPTMPLRSALLPAEDQAPAAEKREEIKTEWKPAREKEDKEEEEDKGGRKGKGGDRKRGRD